MTGYENRKLSLIIAWKTSASNRKVVVSDQLRTVTLMVGPPLEKPSERILVKGHGPAMQETLALEKTFPSEALRVTEPTAAFHFPSGEHGHRSLQGTLAALTTRKVLTTLPTFNGVVVLIVYLTVILETATRARLVSVGLGCSIGTMWTT